MLFEIVVGKEQEVAASTANKVGKLVGMYV